MTQQTCTNCSAAVSEGAKFCSNCGSPVAASSTAEQSPHEGSQQRILTILFADVVGSTEFANKAGLEHYDETIARFHDILRETLVSFGGTVLQAYGDGLLACFGLRKDGEDAAVAGVAAGLALIADVHNRLPEIDLRVGIHSGKVMTHMTDTSKLKPQITGFDVNYAARLQEQAEPGGLVISETTRTFLSRLAHVTYSVEGMAHFKGVTDLAPYAQVETFELSLQSTQNTQILERTAQIEKVTSQQFDDGRENGFAIIGAVGIGKSLFVDAIINSDHFPAPPLVLVSRANLTNAPLFPIKDVIRKRLGLTRSASLRQLTNAAENHALATTQKELAALADALDIFNPEPIGLSAEHLHRLRITVLADVLIKLAQETGNAIILDDFHWADPQTKSVIQVITDTRPDHDCQIVMTSRPVPEAFDFAEQAGLSIVELTPLSPAAAQGILDSYGSLTSEQRDAIVEQSEGNPLFLIALAERKSQFGREAMGANMPTSIEATLQSIIDGFDGFKDILFLASILGRHFTLNHLRLLAGDDPQLSFKLDYLTLNSILTHDGDGYSFSHVMFREAAYNMVKSVRKKTLHTQFAEKLQLKDPDFCDAYPGLVADHFGHGDDKIKFAKAAIAAGGHFLKRADFDLAIHYLSRAMETLEEEGQHEPETLPLKLSTVTLLANANVLKFGYAHPIVLDSYQQLDHLVSHQDSSSLDRMHALYGLFAHRMISGDVRRCNSMIERMAKISRYQDPVLQILWRVNDSAIGLYSGSFDRAMAAHEHIKKLYNASDHSAVFLEVGADPLASILSAEVHIHAQRGNVQNAKEAMTVALDHIDQIGVDLQKPWLHVFSSSALYFAGEKSFAYEQVSKGFALADEQGADFWSLIGRVLHCVFQIFDGDSGEPLQQLEALLKQAEAAGVHLNFPLYYAALAAGKLRTRDLDAANAHSLKAVRRVALFGEGKWAPLIWRVHGQLLQENGDKVGADRAVRIADAYAARSGATIWHSHPIASGEI